MSELLWWHRAGQDVVALGSATAPCGAVVKKGDVYIIREVIWPHDSGAIGFRLRGIRPKACEGYVSDGLLYEPAWAASGFRPVRDTSIESLRGLLSPTPDDVRRLLEEEPAHA